VKTIIIRLPDVEAAMLRELQKMDKSYGDLSKAIANRIAEDYKKLKLVR